MIYRCVFVLILFLCMPSTSLLLGQAVEETPVDSPFQRTIRGMWAELNQLGAAEDRTLYSAQQRAYMETLFEYYLERGDTPTGLLAAESAFLMAGNIGEADRADEVIEHISPDSEVWSRIIRSIGSAYSGSESRSPDDFLRLLWQLEKGVTHPRSRSAVILLITMRLQESAAVEPTIIELLREVVELNADPIMVNMALGHLHEINALQIGQTAPDFHATTLDGGFISLSELRGKVVLLEFWAVWCGPCLPEIPFLKELDEEYGDQDFVLIGISLDDDLEKLQQFVEKEQMAWPQIFQGAAWTGEISQLYNVQGIPRAFLIDREGRVAARDFRGEQTIAEVRRLLKSYE